MSYVSERPDNMRIGMSLATNPEDQSFVVSANSLNMPTYCLYSIQQAERLSPYIWMIYYLCLSGIMTIRFPCPSMRVGVCVG